MTVAHTETPITATFTHVRNWLATESSEFKQESELPWTEADELSLQFNLDKFGRNILLLCAYTNLEPAAQNQLAELLGASGIIAPTMGVALACLPEANWSSLAADSPLRKSGLIRLEGQGSITSQQLILAEPVLFRLLGAPALSTTAAAYLRPLSVPNAMAPNRERLAKDITARLDLPGNPVLHLIGPDPEGKLQALTRAAGRAYALSSQSLPTSTGEIAKLTEELARDMILTRSRLALVHEPQADDRFAELFAELYPGPLTIVSTDALRVGQRRALRLEMSAMTATEQLPVWDHALGSLKNMLISTLPRIADTFRVAPETAELIAAELSATVEQQNTASCDETREDKKNSLDSRAWEACRRAARPRMDDLAHRSNSAPDWDDLILPPKHKAVLASIVAQVRNRTRVYEDWRFGPRLQSKGLGISALFSGPSGAGKSMAGEVLGAALDLDVYRVDLSSLVSKWVGETEKNLRRVFDAAEDGGVILQFDEADALFGRRSEVKDSHDRHANIEVSYLLQRLEAFRGLCILTTNMRDNIDEAFLRRIRFVLEFRFPDQNERRTIWEGIFPDQVPKEAIDLDRLAQLKIPGGSIRNIALGAAFLAADKKESVTMTGLYAAAKQEYEKLGRSMTDSEQAGWL